MCDKGLENFERWKEERITHLAPSFLCILASRSAKVRRLLFTWWYKNCHTEMPSFSPLWGTVRTKILHNSIYPSLPPAPPPPKKNPVLSSHKLFWLFTYALLFWDTSVKLTSQNKINGWIEELHSWTLQRQDHVQNINQNPLPIYACSFQLQSPQKQTMH